jgi:hypothetical protein
MGLPSGMCCKSVGSLCGACPWCNLVGVYKQNKTTYPGAVRFLSDKDPKKPRLKNLRSLALRRKYKKEFAGVPEYQRLWNQKACERMTLEKANESADKVLASLAVSIFTN